MSSETRERPGTASEREIRFQVYGRVQGVGFRWWTRTQALRLQLTGEVRNLPDGSVEIRARGGAEQLERFATLLRAGAPAAHVDRVDQAADRDVPRDEFQIVH
jgi:acylphosphatase